MTSTVEPTSSSAPRGGDDSARSSLGPPRPLSLSLLSQLQLGRAGREALGAASSELRTLRTTDTWPADARAATILIFAFMGVESALVPSGEVRDPARTVPRARV